MQKSWTTRIAAAVAALMLVLTIPGAALGAPIDTKRAEAARVKEQVDELDVQVEIAAEDYNEANAAYQAVSKQVAESEARLTELTARQETLQNHLDVRVEGMYRTGPLGFLEILFSTASFEEFATTWDLLNDMNERDATTVAELKRLRVEVEATQARLREQQAEAKAQRDVMAQRKAEIQAKLDERQRKLSGLESEIAALKAAEEAARRAAYRSPAGDYGTPSGAAHGDVVAIAKSKLGAPYRWGASGPNAFDCSGFTMWVYSQIGISLPHSSRAQIGVGERVSRANLQPGDLVFFGLSRIHHVGIYVGGGMYIHAPHTGDVVKISSLNRSDYAGACRP
ncbi:MAG: C40 family peptidase [Coriobacteriia bacterium]